MKKRLLSILLVMTMILGMFPTTAFAAPTGSANLTDSAGVVITDAPGKVTLKATAPAADATSVTVEVTATLAYTAADGKGTYASPYTNYQGEPFDWNLQVLKDGTEIEYYTLHQVDPYQDSTSWVPDQTYYFEKLGTETAGTSTSKHGVSSSAYLVEPVSPATRSSEIKWTMTLPVTPGQRNTFSYMFNHGNIEGGKNEGTFYIDVKKTPVLNIRVPENPTAGENVNVVVTTDTNSGTISLVYGTTTYGPTAVSDGKATFTVNVADTAQAMTATQTITDTEVLKYRTDTATATLSASAFAPRIAVTLMDDTSVIGTQYVNSGDKLGLLNAPVKAGYDFEGWYTTATFEDGTKFSFDTAITASTTLYAKYTQNNNWYDVNFVANSKFMGTQKVQHNASAFDPGYTVEGYTIEGWYTTNVAANQTDSTKFTFGTTKVTSNLTLYAKVTAVSKVTITYDDGLTEVAATNMPANGDVLPNTDYTIPEVIPAAAGYTFKGWKIGTDTTVYQPGHNFKPTANTTITAQWTEIPGEVTITYTAGAGVTGVTVPDNVTITEGDSYTISNMVPVREGYVFNGWSVVIGTVTAVDKKPGEAITASDNVTLTAQWTEDKVTITWPTTITGVTVDGITGKNTVTRGSTVTFWLKLEAGYDPSTLTVTANDVPLSYVKAVMETTVEDVTTTETRYYYTFTAAANTVVKVSAPSKYTYIVTLPTGDHFTAKFDSKDELAESVTYGGSSTAFTVTAAEGWTINGVYANGTKLTATGGKYQVTNVTSNTTVTVDMTEIVFRTVTYVLDGKQMATQSVASGVNFTLLKAPVPTGYTWDNKWYTDEGYATEYTANKTDKDLILYGKLDANTYTISYNLNGGTSAVIAATTKTYGQAVQLSTTVPTLDGYTFKGWAMESAGVAVYQPGDTFSAEITSNITLYAVWEKNTYTVTINAGDGYTIHTDGPLTVEHGENFTFSVLVDKDHKEKLPQVWVKPTTYTAAMTEMQPNGDVAKYNFTVSNVTEDIYINVLASLNDTYTVDFKYTGLKTGHDLATATYMTQQVEWNQKATQPAAPTVEGYKFVGWVDGDGDPYSFATPITANTTIYAKFEAITPTVTFSALNGTGWTIKNVKATQNGTLGDAMFDTTGKSFTIDYGTDVTFDLVISKGYDYSGLSVAANGYALARVGEPEVDANGVTTISYRLTAVKEDTTIAVTGVVRKTITITYNDNARDDVSDMPVQQVVKYYLTGDNDKITTQKPVRTGYEFLGWSLDSDRDPAKFDTDTCVTGTSGPKCKDRDFKAGDDATFTTDTVLYAIWEAKSTTISLEIQGSFDPNYSHGKYKANQFEGEEITLVATITASGNVQGDVTFYRQPINFKTDVYEELGTATVVGNKATLSNVKVGAYETDTAGPADYLETYWVKFTPVTDEGYASSDPKLTCLRVWSKALAWNGTATNSNQLTIKQNGTEVTAMTAGQTYTLHLPAVKALDGPNNITLKAGTHYEVAWQYRATATGDWSTVEEHGGDTFQVTSEYSGYAFRALVKPMTPFVKAASYTGNDPSQRIADKYENYLITKATKDTVLQPTTTTMTLSDVDTATGSSLPYAYKQYEGKEITLTVSVKDTKATPTAATTGMVEFYTVGASDPFAQVDVNGKGQAQATYTLPEYEIGKDDVVYFYAVYTDEAGTYKTSNTTTVVDLTPSATAPTTDQVPAANAVKVLSTTITWETEKQNITSADHTVVVTDGNKLTIYKGTDMTDANKVTTMEANTVYTLKIPAVYDVNGEKLTVGKDYTVEWVYKNGEGEETKYDKPTDSDSVVIDAEVSQYAFRAIVTPVKDATRSVYNKAAGYENLTAGENTYLELKNDDAQNLTTEWTPVVAAKETTTDLVIVNTDGKLTEKANVAINGSTDVFSNDHLAQFEGQKVTLKATVKETDTDAEVTAGSVKFYRYVNGTEDELLNTTQVTVDGHGVATFEVEVKAYVTADNKTAIDNVDKFYAVYEAHKTWATSASVDVTTTTSGSTTTTTYGDPATVTPTEADVVYIKSTSIYTPIIESQLAGTWRNDAGANKGGDKKTTSYNYNLADLLAGVEHTFTLRQTGAAVTADKKYSVVALDGRTVDAENYSIQWLVKTGTNEEQAANEATQATFIVEDSKVGDMYRVKLSAKGDMKVDAYSKYVKIGTKQDVEVVVTAEDKILSTDAIDVYQLDEITLTATVAAAEEGNATMKPTGTVAFYYNAGVDQGKTYWVKLGEAALTEDTDGEMRASIKTTELPVTATNNTQRDVEITAIYQGSETFNESAKATGDTATRKYAIVATPNCTTVNKTVTVYSSVVFVTNIENTTNAGSTKANGIYITVTEGSLLNNEDSVTLKLSDIYTLDYNDTLAETVAKLKLGTDYTVQWQELENAAAFAGDYAGAANWQDITGKTGNTCEFSVKQGAAYRAKITVNETPIAKGSFTEVDQTVGGRKVYYSNILVAAKAPSTLTVNVNTRNTAEGYEGIVQGETVTVHTFTSGATGTTPISELTVTIQKDGATEPEPGFPKTKTNVNGHVSFDWVAAEPGYYTLTLNAKYTNGYSDKTITRTLIVRDNDYSFTVSGDNTTYNGKAQGLNVTVDNMGIESALADDSVVVYYYTDAARTQQVEPTQAGTYYVTIRLQESAYWTEKIMTTTKDDPTKDLTFTIKRREVQVVDLVAQAKVYDGTTNANILEIILNDAETDQTTTGLPTGTTGIINGDSVYATGVMTIGNAGAGSQTLSVSDVVLHGDDAHNYKVGTTSYTETINVQRSQVKGYIVEGTVFKYTGSNITVPADQIYLIDQAGNKLTANDYTVTYYYHNGDGVEKVTAMNKMGKYTVIARPEQTNYKGGASATVYVGETAQNGTADTTPTSALIDITNTVELYGAAGNQGIVATATTGTISKIEYYVGSGSTTTDVPTAAGRYLVKVTASTGDTAYGIYTVVKANPVLTLTATDAEYTSAQIVGVSGGTYNGGAFPAGTYYSYTGGTIQGVSYTAPTEVGTYVVTAHVPETENYTAHEVSATFTITPKALKITADSLQRHQYGAYPDLTASFEGLASSTYAPDTSLRDVQIQPELVFATGYTNSASDQVGNEYAVKPVAALARNYKITYEDGNVSVTEVDANPELAIHGMIDNGNGVNIAYYGDVIQLYPYGSQKGDVINNSSILKWSVSDTSVASIDENGLLKILKPGMFTVTLTRGEGTQQIKTELAISAWRKEVTIDVEDQDKVYSGTEQTYNGTVTVNGLINGDTVTPECKGGNKRTDVGSQITTYQLDPATVGTLYVSEIYGGLFTINDKDVTVKPGAQETVYGTKEAYEATKYTVEGEVNSVAALTNSQVASIADAYGNLDVLDGYEILVTGTENKNYNVKYQTKQTGKDVGDVNVTPLALTVTTGTLNDQVGMTSGSLNPVGKYPVNGAVVDSSETLGTTNVRMYGEPNWVMDYALATLIAGDSMADLVGLSNWLVGFNYNIGGNASVIYTDKSTAIDQSQYDTTKYTIPAKDDQKIWTNTTGKHVAQINVENYTENLNLGTQYIYQRPVELKCTVSDAHKELARSTSKEDLQSILIQNITADKLGGVGGLATLLKHTVADLDLKITYQGYNGTTWVDITGDFANLAGYTKIKATIKVGNPNYYAESLTVEFTVRAARYIIEINPFAAQYAVAKLYLYDEDTSAKTLTWFDEDVSLAAGATSNVMRCKIYQNIGSNKYADYAYEPTIVNAMMKKGSTVGEYTISYNTLTCHAQMFAIADGYIIIDNP